MQGIDHTLLALVRLVLKNLLILFPTTMVNMLIMEIWKIPMKKKLE